MARIKHPRPQIGTIVDRLGGVVFRDGFAEVDLSDKPNLAAAYAQHGYVVEETLTDDSAESPFEPLPDAVEGDTAVRVSKASKRARNGTAKPSEKADEALEGASLAAFNTVPPSADEAAAAFRDAFSTADED